jgi:hypothetical protein
MKAVNKTFMKLITIMVFVLTSCEKLPTAPKTVEFKENKYTDSSYKVVSIEIVNRQTWSKYSINGKQLTFLAKALYDMAGYQERNEFAQHEADARKSPQITPGLDSVPFVMNFTILISSSEHRSSIIGYANFDKTGKFVGQGIASSDADKLSSWFANWLSEQTNPRANK